MLIRRGRGVARGAFRTASSCRASFLSSWSAPKLIRRSILASISAPSMAAVRRGGCWSGRCCGRRLVCARLWSRVARRAGGRRRLLAVDVCVLLGCGARRRARGEYGDGHGGELQLRALRRSHAELPSRQLRVEEQGCTACYCVTPVSSVSPAHQRRPVHKD